MVTAAKKLKDTCSLEAFSVPFHCNKTLLYKTLEWLSLISGPKAKSSSSEITNLTSFTISYSLGGSSGIFRTLKTLKSSSLSAFSDKHFLLYFTNSMVCLCEWYTLCEANGEPCSVVFQCLVMTEGSLKRGNNAKRHSTSLWREWPEMDKACGPNFPF